MAATNPNNRFSFGVELEFAVAFIQESQQDELPLDAEDFDQTYRKLIVVPNEPEPDPGMSPPPPADDEIFLDSNERSCGVKAAYEHVQKTLDRLGLNQGTPTCIFYPNELEEFHMFSKWWADSDDSICLPGDLDISLPYKGVGWIAVEVTSPALWSDNPQSFEEVRKVCNALKNEYWTMTTPTCGLHFHIGRGFDWMNARDLRRIAALLFAADPILSQLHPEHRLGNRHCPSIRDFSCVATGLTQFEARRRLDKQLPSWASSVETESEQFITAQSSCPSTSTSSFDENRIIPRGALNGYSSKDPIEIISWTPGTAVFRNPSISHPTTIGCAAEILSATRAGVVQRLLSGHMLTGRLAYHFGHFDESLYAEPATQRTIEFRQCAATLDSDEVVAFARLWVALCERASDGPLSLTCQAIQKCSDAEVRRKRGLAADFDVFDLLAMLGLSNEAQALQTVLLQR
ncbi:hypothetical protein M406DRAFT_67010 [Cryphonectria parasitica EP155]|uniref:Amidoligase enzyme n=1 Tax=Cryphonectria parasitica (strain ATCC 38755 / EP155) TaxID=660469 RepID=A0A9P4YD00_CRYP1|nr:uncharacterized protein M406DRAFT_67010 [Cryphonectria parasitica EP155]KAF3770622.1 hypothetical protein M406DRAFT_67010 [Cryphonectria parasitica EP155]